MKHFTLTIEFTVDDLGAVPSAQAELACVAAVVAVNDTFGCHPGPALLEET